MTASPTLPRIVPGAAPPIELSKSQKKKRKVPKADDAVSPAEHPEFHEPPGLVSRIDSALPDEEQKSSLMVDMMNRRLKAIAKKIVCVLAASLTPFSLFRLREGFLLTHLPISKS